MNKAELTAAIVKKTGFTKKDAEKAPKRWLPVKRFRSWVLVPSKCAIVLPAWPAIPAPASRSRSPLPRLPFSRLARP